MNNFTLKIALRYLKSKKTHNAVNIISIVAMCGVVVTTAAMVCVLSVFNGFSSLIGSKLAANSDPNSRIMRVFHCIFNKADDGMMVGV